MQALTVLVARRIFWQPSSETHFLFMDAGPVLAVVEWVQGGVVVVVTDNI